MNAESDHDLTTDQWEALKALRVRATTFPAVRRRVLAELIALGLVTMCEGLPVITSDGRKVLVRGSSRLWDVAA